MFIMRNSVRAAGPRIASGKEMNADQLCTALKKIHRGASPWIFNATVRTQTSPLQLRRLDTRSCYWIASAMPIKFSRFLEFLSGLKGKLFKAWLIYAGKEKIEHEVTLTSSGVSLDGSPHQTKGLPEGLELVRQQAPALIKGQTYKIGMNAGAIILGEPSEHGLGIEPKLQKIGVSSSSSGSESNHFMAGVTDLEQFQRALSPLLEKSDFLGLEFVQPALSVVVREARIYHDRVRKSFSCECILEPVAPEIERNLFNALFDSDTRS